MTAEPIGTSVMVGTVSKDPVEPGRAALWRPVMRRRDPFTYFRSGPEIIRLAVMMDTGFPRSLCNVRDLLHERGADVSHKSGRYCWPRFGPLFAAEIRKRRIAGLRSSYGRGDLDEMFVKINGERHHLWRAVDNEE